MSDLQDSKSGLIYRTTMTIAVYDICILIPFDGFCLGMKHSEKFKSAWKSKFFVNFKVFANGALRFIRYRGYRYTIHQMYI